MRTTTRTLLSLPLLLLVCASAVAQPVPLDRMDALVRLAEVWSAVKFRDPRVWTRPVDWDNALLRAVPKVRGAADQAEYLAVIAAMLAELNDPGTRVVPAPKRDAKSPAVTPFERDGDTLIVRIGPYADAAGESELFTVYEKLPAELANAKSVVFDLRTRSADVPGWILRAAPLSRKSVPIPARRGLIHSGYAPQTGQTSGGYFSGLQVITPASMPAPPPNVTVPSRVVIIVGAEVPEIAAGLWWSGEAALVAEGPLSDDRVFGTTSIDLVGGARALIRTTESAVTGLTADAVAAPVAGSDPAMKKALEIARSSSPLRKRPAPQPGGAVVLERKDEPYATISKPDVAYRLLGLFRLWSVIDLFYPYKSLIVDWDAVLREFIPRFLDARNGSEYALAVTEMVARIDDGHSSARGHEAIDAVRGPWSVPIEARLVEGRFIVTGKRESFPADTAIAIGDELVSIDGEPLGARMAGLRKYTAAAQETARIAYLLNGALRGPEGSAANLVLRGADGATRTVRIARTAFSPVAKEGPAWRIVNGTVGVVDLTRLNVGDVDAMFTALAGTRAIIFDMRGYPRGTAWAIAPRINTRNAQTGATFRRVMITPESGDSSRSGFYFEQPLPKSDKPKYTGRTVMLIDDRTISQAEHTGLFFEAASGTAFIGSNSAGTNGDVTNLVLPGGITVFFTGHDVRHADGRQLQRIGLVPEVNVTPTVAGIRAGRDEVLERALEFVNR